MSEPRPAIEHRDSLPRYGPPGHAGTVNVRLVDAGFGGGFELVHGTVAPGGRAERHNHGREYQVIYVVEGTGRVALGDQPARTCGPGTVVRIPPGLDHEVVNDGTVPLKVLIVYSPPLARRADTALD
ncbi:MAG TPA: cupin domain-containing protein [Alphaproteobacteria bacterium]